MARIFFCGDIINQFSDNQFIGESLKEAISTADYAVCNLEGVVASGKEMDKGMLQRPRTVQFIKEAGFNLCLLANNHITDYGIKELEYTINVITKNNLKSIGAGVGMAQVYSPLEVEIDGQRIAFINVCEAQVGQFDNEDCAYGYAWIGWPYLQSIISETKHRVDFLFVCVHAGLEHYELPLKEFRALYKRFCDWGADCVVGSHPHIAQGFETYNDSYIFYSLGNFYFPRTKEADEIDYENSSFSIIFDTKKRNFEIVYHAIKEHSVEKVEAEQSQVDIVRLNKMLLRENYEIKIREQNDEAYDSLVFRLYQFALNGQEPSDNVLRKAKNIVKYIFKLANYNSSKEHLQSRNALLQRLVENETYRYLTIDVLKHRNDE